MDRRTFLTIGGGMAALAALAGCGAPTGEPRPVATRGRGVLDVARSNGLTSFVRAVETAGLADHLSGSGPYTLFAPTDAAFRTAGVSPTGDRDALRRLVAYHVVPGQVGSSFMSGMDMNHLTSTGAALRVDGRGGGVRVNEANALRLDIEAANGVVHVIDRVLRPA
jgi:uncharacterized surface protein with fasciclin (FAS1) repeats